MEPSALAMEMNRHSLGWFRGRFGTLSPPEPASVKGVHEAEFVGPGWLRLAAGPSLALVGLKGWWGKDLDGEGRGWNIVRRGDSFRRVLEIKTSVGPSLIDGKPALIVSYSAGLPFPWPWIVDELRRYDETSLLGLTLAKSRLARFSAFPFLLHSCPTPPGL